MLLCFLAASFLPLAAPAIAQETTPQADFEDYNLSYIYAAVLGTGTYKIDGRRITQLQARFKWTPKEVTATDVGYTVVAPVGIGYDGVTDDNWLERIFDEDLVVASVLPGLIAQIPLTENWTLKPLGNLGVARDFTREETIVMGVLGLRALGTWAIGGSQELRWGGGLRLAGEYQWHSEDSLAFTIFETGIDYRRDTGFDILERKVNAGVYLTFSHFQPSWEFSETPQKRSEVLSITELGVSLGLRRPRKILGIPVNRVRVGYKQGKDFQGWTIGGDFPF